MKRRSRTIMLGSAPGGCRSSCPVLYSAIMTAPILLREEIVPLSSFIAHPSKYLKGVVRLVDKDAHPVGLFLDSQAVDELLEDLEAASSAFRARLEHSRRSGRVSAKAIERRLGL